MVKRSFFNLLMMALIFQFSLERPNSESQWKLKNIKDNISIYTRSVTHTNLKELKMTTRVKSNLGSIVKILDSIELYPEWMYGCREGKKLKTISVSEKICLTTINFPNPFSDRNVVSRNTIHQDESTKIITIKSLAIKDETCRRENTVLITEFSSSWVLIPKDNGEVLIESYLFCDPGGNIPNWLVNRLLYKSPFKTVLNLRKRLADPEFQNVRLGMIME